MKFLNKIWHLLLFFYIRYLIPIPIYFLEKHYGTNFEPLIEARFAHEFVRKHKNIKWGYAE